MTLRLPNFSSHIDTIDTIDRFSRRGWRIIPLSGSIRKVLAPGMLIRPVSEGHVPGHGHPGGISSRDTCCRLAGSVTAGQLHLPAKERMSIWVGCVPSSRAGDQTRDSGSEVYNVYHYTINGGSHYIKQCANTTAHEWTFASRSLHPALSRWIFQLYFLKFIRHRSVTYDGVLRVLWSGHMWRSTPRRTWLIS